MKGTTLTLEKYHRFFLDPWGTRITIDQLNQILFIHGFIKQHHGRKNRIMECLVGQVDLLPLRRSTLHREALSAASPPSAAAITAAQARDDVEAIGWVECPIGFVAAFSAPGADAPELVERLPRPADFVLAGRRPRSKQTRGSAYVPPPGGVAASKKVKAGAPRKRTNVIVKEEPEPELSAAAPPPPPPPLWTRSPTPPPPSSSPPPLPPSPQDPLPPSPPLHFHRQHAPPLLPTPPPPPMQLHHPPPYFHGQHPPPALLQTPPPPMLMHRPPPHLQGQQPPPGLPQTPPPPEVLWGRPECSSVAKLER